MTSRQSPRADDRTDAIRRAALDLAQEAGFAKLSIEKAAARAGVGKHTVYRRWPSKGLLFLDALLSQHEPAFAFPDTGDIVADLRTQTYAAVDLLGRPPWGPLFRSMLGEAQQDPMVAADLNKRFIRPQEEALLARIRTAMDRGQVSPDLDLDMAMAMLSGPLYFRFLITQESVGHDFVDRMLDMLFAGMAAAPPADA
ncbi:TetR/AcrR family transcriptional regulator [Dactylosporangium sp. CS-033363]|uniref:TetR/AcrR family transcriptional regulator n=1 Tax=Dactylosporangium sp. CS-033363 TaxID=3239935 RepID=UPI003D8E2289